METRFYCGDEDISKRVTSLKKHISFEGKNIIGNVSSAEYTVTIKNKDGYLNHDKLSKTFTIATDSKLFDTVYVYDYPQELFSDITLTLYDNIIKTNIPFLTDASSYPKTIQSVLDEITNMIGIDIDYTLVHDNVLNKVVNTYDTSIMIRSYLGWIAELSACNVMCTPNGVIKFYLINKAHTKNIENDQYVYEFKTSSIFECKRVLFDNGIKVIEKRGIGEGNTVYISDDNPYISDDENDTSVSQAQIDLVYELVGGITFTSVSGLKMRSISDLILGEIIHYKDYFDCMALSYDIDMYNGEFAHNIMTLDGVVDTTDREKAIVVASQESKKKLNVTLNNQEQKLTVVAEQVDDNVQDISKLQVSLEGMSSEVMNVVNQIFKFESGSWNLFINTNKQLISQGTLEDMPLDINISNFRNKDICISVNVQAINTDFNSGYLGAEFDIVYTDNTRETLSTRWYAGQSSLQYTLKVSGESIDKRIYTHYKIQDKEIKHVSSLKLVNTATGEYVRSYNPKVEFGTYPTGYDFDVPYIRDNVETINKNYTLIEQKVDTLSLQAISTTNEITTIKGEMSDVQIRLQSTELKLTPTEITAMVNEKIGADGELHTTKVSITNSGLNVYGGGIRIYNNSNTAVFYADGNGNLVLSGTIEYAQINSANISISQDARIGNILYLGSASDSSSYRYISMNGGIIYPSSDDAGDCIFYRSNEVGIHANRRATLYAGSGTGIPSVIAYTDGGSYLSLSAMSAIYASRAITVSSDIRLKNSIQEVDVSFIDELDILSFKYNGSTSDEIGMIANQYINKEYSKYFLFQKNDGYYGINYTNVNNALIKYCQQLKKELINTEKEIAEIKARIGG